MYDPKFSSLGVTRNLPPSGSRFNDFLILLTKNQDQYPLFIPFTLDATISSLVDSTIGSHDRGDLGDGANWSSNKIPDVHTCIKIKFGNVLLSLVIFATTYCLLSENNLTKLNEILLNSIQPLDSIILTSLRHPLNKRNFNTSMNARYLIA